MCKFIQLPVLSGTSKPLQALPFPSLGGAEAVFLRLNFFFMCSPDGVQGKMQMWVDIFPEEGGSPGAPINVSPRKPDE